MKSRKFYQGLKGKLVLLFLIVGIIPLVAATVLSVVLSSEALATQAFEKLDAIHEIKNEEITSYFKERSGDVKVLADNYTTRQAMVEFANSFDQLSKEKARNLYITNEKERLDYSPQDESGYKEVHQKYHPIFRKYLMEYGYYDIFLVDIDGNVVYTVYKEDDYGTNLINGKYSDQNISRAFKKVKDQKKDFIWLVDFEAYKPSNGDPASFIATPIFDKGTRIGVLIFQMPIQQIDKIMNTVGASGGSLDAYLLGKDFTMRNNSRLTKAGKDGKKHDVLKTKVKTEPTIKAFKSNKKLKGIFKDYRGTPVLGKYSKLKFLNLEWLSVVEIDESEALASIGSLKADMLILAVVLIGVAIFVGFFIGGSIATPIVRGVSFAQSTSQRDLTQTLDIKIKKDETGDLVEALNLMQDNLKVVVKEMSDVSSTLAATSEEINGAANGLSEVAQTQAASVEETSASTEELTAAITRVAEQGNIMKEKSEESLDEATEFKERMQQVSEDMINITASTEKIGDIVKVITDIADQTNLLSLNAAIEAARAGEHGRGFAVVAEAISTLASRSAESTKEIESLIQQTVQRINKGVKAVQESTQSFNSIVDTIKDNNSNIQNISKSMEEQQNGSEQIQKATEEVNNQTQNISSSAEEMAASTSELQKLAERLNSIVNTFQLNDSKTNGHQTLQIIEKV